MASRVRVEVQPPMAEVRARLKRTRQDIGDMKKPYARAATYLDRWVQQNFKTEGGKVGKWAPLKVGGRWSRRRGRRFFDSAAKVLQDTGRLRQSFLPFVTRRNAGIGSDLPYAKKHEEGKGERGRKLPARRMLPKQKEVRKDLREILNEHVKGITGKNLFKGLRKKLR